MGLSKWTAAVVGALATALVCGSTVGARTAVTPPANDMFANAQVISGTSGTVTGSNVGATKQTGEPNHAGNPGGASVWYRWTAPTAGTAGIDTLGSGFDTLLAVYTGTAVNALKAVASNDDCCGGRQSKVSFIAAAGTTYQIAVDGYRKATGSITLHWNLVSPPANDLFANAQAITGSSGTASGSNVGATKEPGEPNHAGNAGGASVWYRWTAPTAGTASIDTSGSSFDTLLAVYTGTAVSALKAVASDDDVSSTDKTSKVTFSALSGTTYQIAVDGWNGAAGSVTLHWSLVSPPANDLFANAQAITGPSGTASGSNVGAAKEAGEPNHAGNAGGASVWYRWTAASAAPVTIDTSGSSFDTLLAVYTGSAVNALTAVASNDDVSKTDKTSKVTLTPAPGTTYQIAVDGWNGATGSVTLHWSQSVPANDMFANAQTITGANGTATGSNVYATKEPGEPNHAGNPGGASIWYRWTAPSDGTATLDTLGSGFDTLLAVYTGTTVDALTPVASNDNAPGVQTSQLSFAAASGTTYQIAVDGSGGASGSVTLHWNLGTQSGDPVLVAAGDQHACDGTGDDQTAALLGPLDPQVVASLGDASGEYGYLSEYQNCYDPTWGAFKSITAPVPGNHDYEGDSTASGYFTYFGAAAGQPGQGWYSYDLGAWHIVALNANCSLVGGCGNGSPEVQWLRQDLASHPAACTLAYFHQPLFTSTPEPGYNGPVYYLFAALYYGGVDVVLNAHSKAYERFAPQDYNGNADPQWGIREFIVGTGGEPLDPTDDNAANSEAWQASTLGVLKLTLHSTSYDWEFVPVAGGSYSDSGTGSCHAGTPSGVFDAAPLVPFPADAPSSHESGDAALRPR